MAKRHVIVGGGTAGVNAIRTIRAHDRGDSEIVLVSAERPYSRMVLPYYLGRSIGESHVFTATPAQLANQSKISGLRLGSQIWEISSSPIRPARMQLVSTASRCLSCLTPARSA